MSQQWPGQKVGAAPAQPAPAPQVGPTLRPVLTLPDPKGDREEQRDEARLDLTIQGNERANADARFNRISTYRKEFLTEPTVRQFREVENATRQIVELAGRESDQPGPGDIALIISFMKALDPGSVVRETEFATAENAGGVPETVRNAYNKLVNGGRLTPEIKREFASAATSMYNSRLNGYNTFAQDYRGLIEREGEDPDAQGVRLAEPITFGGAATGGDGLPAAPVTVEQSAAAWGDGPKFDANGNPILPGGKGSPGFDGGVYDAQGNFLFLTGTVTDESPPQDPRDEMGFLESLGETITGSERSTPEIEALPDWTDMPAPGFSGFMASLGSLVSSPEETAKVLLAQGVAKGVRQDAKGNFILTGQDGQEYAIKPGFRLSDTTRAAGAIAAFTPAGRATTIAGGAAGAAGTQAAIEATQAAAGGSFDTGEVAVAGAGGAGGVALNRGVQVLRNARGGAVPPSGGGGSGAVQAADNLNALTGSKMNLMPADVAGPGLKNATGAMSKLPASAAILNRRAQQLTREAEKAKNALVELAGGKAETEIAGEQALSGAQSWLKSSRAKVNALYAKARSLGGDQPVDLATAREVLDGHIAELSQTPGSAAGLERLRALRAELDKPFPVEGVKRMRTRLRDDFGGDGLRATDLERRVGQVVDAAEDDIITSLQSAGKGDAAKAYRAAADAYRERVQVIDDVLVPIIGKKGSAPKSGEDIIASLEQATKSKSARLGKFMAILPDEDRGIVRGTLLERLGRATASKQDDTAAAFSLETFLTNWSKMSDRAKGTLFGGELRSALDDLAKVASARRETNQFINFSNTGAPIGYAAAGGLLASGPKGWAILSLDGIGGAILQSPSLARWLAKAPRNPALASRHIDRLSAVAKANPAISADIIDLQARLRATLPAAGSQMTSPQAGALSIAAQNQNADSNTTGSGTQ